MKKSGIRRFCYVCFNEIRQHGNQYYGDHRFVQLYQSLVPMFPEVLLLASGGGLIFQPRELTGGFPNLRVTMLPSHGGRFQRALRRIPGLWSALGNADLVCIDMPSEFGFLAALICKLRGKPFLVQILGDWRHAVLFGGPQTIGRRIKAAAGERIIRLIVRNSRLVFAQGRNLYEKYERENPSAMKSDCVRSTLTREAFYSRPLGQFHDPVRLLSVSTLIPLKGLNNLIRAIHLLSIRGLPVKWWCAGDGPCRQSLEDLAHDLGIFDCVKFFGYVHHGQELFKLYKEADIFVLPSLTEGLPNALLEAMAHSLPVIASRVGGIPDAVRNETEGLLVNPGQPELLAEAIANMAANPERVSKMRQAAFRRAEQFSAEALAQRNRDLIEEIFGQIG